jgi:hypothetical protein
MLEIQVPDEVFSGLPIGSEQKEKFVLEAVKEKIEREKKNNLTALLIEGYQATREEDLALTKEFEAADLENL